MTHNDNHNHDRPAVFGSWRAFYAAVIVWLALLIVFFYFFTQHFS